MGVCHVFDAVGNDFSRRQRIEHAVMPHGYTIIDGNGVEFSAHATRLGDGLRRPAALSL